MLNAATSSLTSRVIRSNVVSGVTGPQIFKTDTGNLNNKTRAIKNLNRYNQTGDNKLSWIWDTGKKYIGWLYDGVKWIATHTDVLLGWLIGGIERIKAFNWNATDAQLRAGMKSNFDQLGNIWGSVAGQAVGGAAALAVGIGVGMIVPVIGGAALATAIGNAVLQDRLGEFLSVLGQAITQTLGVLAVNITLEGYIQLRRFIKSVDESKLSAIFGAKNAKWIKQRWGKEGEPDISFNKQMDDVVDSIPVGFTQNFVEEFLDESWDSFIEGGYIIANELNSAYEQFFRAQEQAKGPDRTLRIAPDKQAPDDTITIPPLPQPEAKAQIVSALTTYRQIYNKDIGEWVGDRYEDSIKASPQLRTLKVFFHEREKPPFRNSNGKYESIAYCSIPNPKRGISWQDMKEATKPYTHGYAYARAKFNSGKRMFLQAASMNEAEHKLRELAKLSADKIIGMSTGILPDIEGEPRPLPKKVYPQRAVVTQPKNTLDAQKRLDIDARTFKKEIIKFPLWTEDAPPQFKPF